MSNYTKPHKEGYEDRPEDWLFTALVFANALGNLLDTGQGVVVELSGDLVEMQPEMKKVIVHNNGKQIAVANISERTDLKEGDIVQMISTKDMQN